MSIQSELLALKDSNNIIDAKRAVQWANQHKDSDLYRALEWDDVTAAEEYRIHQVRRLIAIHIVDSSGHRTAISLTIDRTKGGGYRDIEDVMQAEDLRAIALADALAELERVKSKYEWLSELAKVWEAKSAVEQEAQSRRGRRRRAA